MKPVLLLVFCAFLVPGTVSAQKESPSAFDNYGPVVVEGLKLTATLRQLDPRIAVITEASKILSRVPEIGYAVLAEEEIRQKNRRDKISSLGETLVELKKKGKLTQDNQTYQAAVAGLKYEGLLSPRRSGFHYFDAGFSTKKGMTAAAKATGKIYLSWYVSQELKKETISFNIPRSMKETLLYLMDQAGGGFNRTEWKSLDHAITGVIPYVAKQGVKEFFAQSYDLLIGKPNAPTLLAPLTDIGREALGQLNGPDLVLSPPDPYIRAPLNHSDLILSPRDPYIRAPLEKLTVEAPPSHSATGTGSSYDATPSFSSSDRCSSSSYNQLNSISTSGDWD